MKKITIKVEELDFDKPIKYYASLYGVSITTMRRRLEELGVYDKFSSVSLGSQGYIEKRKIEEYNKNPIVCKNCKKVLTYEERGDCVDFCSRTCSLLLHNQIRRDSAKIQSCEVCHNPRGDNERFCSRSCEHENRRIVRQNKLLRGELISSGTIRRATIESRGNICEKCQLTEWMGETIPIDIHHLDGNPNNNAPENIQVLCKNCHALTPSFGAKNKGSGRAKRREFYKQHKYS